MIISVIQFVTCKERGEDGDEISSEGEEEKCWVSDERESWKGLEKKKNKKKKKRSQSCLLKFFVLLPLRGRAGKRNQPSSDIILSCSNYEPNTLVTLMLARLT